MSITLSDFYAWVDSQSLGIRGKKLSEVEKCILEGSIEGLTYDLMAEKSRFEKAYLQNTAGPGLWRFLQKIMGNQYQIGKPYIKDIVEEFLISVKNLPGKGQSWADISQPLATNLPTTEMLYGRTAELKQLLQTAHDSHCIMITGQVGIGKSALASMLLNAVYRSNDFDFEFYLWKPVHHAPLLEDLCQDIMRDIQQVPSDRGQAYTSDDFIQFLKENRCFFILDEVESILKGNSINPYGEKHSNYGSFFRRVIEEVHNSCLVLTSREILKDLDALGHAKRSVNTFHLTGLNEKETIEIYKEYNLSGKEEWAKITAQYRGNPLALHSIASRIKEFFGGYVNRFIEYETTWLGNPFLSKFDQQFSSNGNYNLLEVKILIFIAKQLEKSESITLDSLVDHLIKDRQSTTSKSEILEALNSLTERSVIEKEFTAKALELKMPPVLRKYLLTDPTGAVKNRIAQTV